MSDGPTSFSSITGGFLKRNYGRGSEKIKSAQNLKAYFFSKIPTSPEKPSGEGFFIPINLEGNESGHASNEAESFDNPQSVKDLQFQINAKHTFWPFQLTGFSMEVATSNADSFARTLRRQMDDNSSRFFSDMNRQAIGQATGEMTKVNGAALVGATSVVVDAVKYFRTGMYIDFYASVGGALLAANVKVTGVNVTTLTLTVTALPAAVSDNAVIVKHNVLANAPADYKELFGVNAIVDTLTYNTLIQTLSKVVYPVLQATVVDAGGVNVSNKFLQSIETGVENASNEMVTATWSSRRQRDKYLELLTPMKRFLNDDAMDSGKRKAVEWNGKPWEVDKDFQDDQVFMFSAKGVEKFIIKEPDIVDTDGTTIARLPGSDIFQGYYKSHMNIGSLMPNSNGKGVNLSTL